MKRLRCINDHWGGGLPCDDARPLDSAETQQDALDRPAAFDHPADSNHPAAYGQPSPCGKPSTSEAALKADQETTSTTDFASPLDGLSEKDIRRLRRVDLLEMLVEQGRELERTRAELAEARSQLAQREIAIAECGSIAEAALKLNGVFEAAQAAADQYVQNARRVSTNSSANSSAQPCAKPYAKMPRHASESAGRL